MKMVGVMFPEKDVELMDRVARARRETISVFLRRAAMRELARFLSLPDFDRVALEISDQPAHIRDLGAEDDLEK
ncbi:MAG: hypothetical protein PHZ19_03675 [Candidatus Thermoplasmatota archaeon]|nr:hypothetical protein [Candidatus Thermoplasmatota archaeon]